MIADGKDGADQTPHQPLATKAVNPWGLYGMHGLVTECWPQFRLRQNFCSCLKNSGFETLGYLRPAFR